MRDVFDKLKEQLIGESWPNTYMFKFIAPNSPEKIARLRALFQDETEIRMQPSRSNKYMSLTITLVMMDADEVINIYTRASEIEGVISL